jgi:CRISPR system Cascade subunit CasB
MKTPEVVAPPASEQATQPADDAPGAAPHRANPFSALAAHVRRASTGDRAALARLKPDALRPNELAALSRALLAAGLAPDSWSPQTWPRWALIAQGIALAGHAAGRLGDQLADAGVAESRVTKLLTARGDAFQQLLPRVVRLMASKGIAPNWSELGVLVLKDSRTDTRDSQEADSIRLRIAGPYYSRLARQAAK